MNSTEPAPELRTLETIKTDVHEIQVQLDERVPHARLQLLALVCASKWRVYTKTMARSLDIHAMSKKLSMETHAFDYRVRALAERLERHLCDVDNILSHGNAEVKDARKALVLHIQTLLQRADARKVAASRLLRFVEQLIATMSFAIINETEKSTSDEADMEKDSVKSDSDTEDADEEMLSEGEEEEEAVVEETMESKEEAQPPQSVETVEENVEEEQDDEEEQEEEEEGDLEEEEDEAEDEEKELQSSDSSLPVWTPYYQMERRGDGIYLVAKLRDVHPHNVHVTVSSSTGLITISGVKRPSPKDLLLSQWTGKPTFGRFTLTQRVDPALVNLDQATQQLASDGTLVLRFPFYYLHHPRMFPRALYAPRQHCAVW